MEQKKERSFFLSDEKPTFLNREENFFFLVFWWFTFLSLSPLETKQVCDQKQEHKTTQRKGKVPSSIERRLFGLFLLSYFSISATHSRSFVCSRQIVEEKKESSLFFCLFQRCRKRTRKERTRNAKKKALLFLSLFLIEKAKTSFARVPKKQEEEEEEKKHKQKRRGG